MLNFQKTNWLKSLIRSEEICVRISLGHTFKSMRIDYEFYRRIFVRKIDDTDDDE